VLQKGRWAYVEVAVPDTLYKNQNWLTANGNQIDWSYWIPTIWNGSFYHGGDNWSEGTTNAGIVLSSGSNKFLDGSIMKDVYGESQSYESILCMCMMSQGLKGETKNRMRNSIMANQSITYNGVGGCKRRIGFAIKMPPYDGLASSTAGINQAKLKLEVYVP